MFGDDIDLDTGTASLPGESRLAVSRQWLAAPRMPVEPRVMISKVTYDAMFDGIEKLRPWPLRTTALLIATTRQGSIGKRISRVTPVERHVALDDAFDEPARWCTERPAECRDNALAEAVLEAERVSDRHRVIVGDKEAIRRDDGALTCRFGSIERVTAIGSVGDDRDDRGPHGPDHTHDALRVSVKERSVLLGTGYSVTHPRLIPSKTA